MKRTSISSVVHLLIAMAFFYTGWHTAAATKPGNPWETTELVRANTDSKEQRDALLWKVTHKDQESPAYLFGTMHLMKSGYLQNWPNVREAFKESDRVVVETVIDSSKMMQIGRMAMLKNTTYQQIYDSATLDTVMRYIEQKLRMPRHTLMRMKPMQLAALSARKAFKKVNSPLKSAKGKTIDLYFAEKGKKMDKKVIPLETMIEQGRMLFNEMSIDKQAKMLLQQIRRQDQMATFTHNLLKYYRNENLSDLYSLYKQEKFSTQNLGFLVEERNKNWLSTLTKYFKKGNTFAAVGALHLPGKAGLLKLLEKKGFQIQPMPVK